jgi:hypothetical protein
MNSFNQIGQIMSGGSVDQQIGALKGDLLALKNIKKQYKENVRHNWANRSSPGDNISVPPLEVVEAEMRQFIQDIGAYEHQLHELGEAIEIDDDEGETDANFLAWRRGLNLPAQFGRRRMASLGTFTKRYRRKNPRASVRTIANKYRRAQQLFA